MAAGKDKALVGTFWLLVERFSVQLCQFVISIVLARLLMPEDYGVVGMLSIFMAIAQAFLDSGFNRALIQKKDRSDIDYSTVFYFNIAIAVVLYSIFFITAPLIASFYNTPILKSVARASFFALIINAFSIVQTSKLTIELNFKLQTIATVFSIVISGTIGIICAYNGLGVWALVIQSLVSATIRCIVLWMFSHWKPLLAFSKESFNTLFSFGSKLLIGELLHQIATNLYTLVIGKKCRVADVGYYNRANGFASLPPGIFGSVLNSVMFPILSERQDDNESLLGVYRKMFRVPMFLFVPLMFGMAALAKPIVLALIGQKWLDCVVLMQVLCIGYVFGPMSTINLNLLYVKGRSDLTLKLDLIKKPIMIFILIISIPFGLWWVCFGKAAYDLVAFAINSVYTKKILNYGFFQQFREIIPIIINSIVMFFAITFVISFFDNVWIQILLGFVSGVVIYGTIAFVYREPAFKEIFQITKQYIKKIRNNA